MELLNALFSGPVLPATFLFGLMVAWSLLAMLGTVDLKVPGADLDLDIDVDMDSGGVSGTDGMSVLFLKWLNLRNIPIVLWLSAFAVLWWVVSAGLWLMVDSMFFESPGWIWSAILAVKNILITLPLTKWVTSPMGKWFIIEHLSASDLVGKECEISSLEANADFGQAKFKTEGSPLLLNIRTDGEHLVKGTPVWITHYDAQNRIYIVTPTGTDRVRRDEDFLKAEEE